MEQINNKELNSHDLAREIEIVKLQEENEELKSQLRGTTHCFDEEEHKRLKEENEELKKQLEECQLQNFDLREDIMIQKQAFPNKLIKDKSFYDLYDIPTYEDLLTQQKEFIDWLECEVNDYKCKNPLIVENLHTQYDIREIETDMLMKVLNKYKEIIGVSDENTIK